MDIRLLGHLEVFDGGGQLVAVRGDRQRALLALLSVFYPRPVTTDRLIDALWADPTVEAPEVALQVAVSRLRKAIGEVVVTVPGGYRLDAPAGTIDLDRFHLHARRGRQLLTLGHPGPAAEAFRQALAQWRSAPLIDLAGFGFAEEAARSLELERIDVAEWLMEAMLEAGDHHLVVGELAGLAEAHPTREHLWYLLMLALYRSGRQAEALKAFGRLRQFLGEEMGIEPSRQVADLEERILLHDPSLNEQPVDGHATGWAEDAQLITFKPGEVIVEEGVPANAVYWIEDGVVEVFRASTGGEQVLAELGRGRYFGELASLLGTGRTASVRAVSPTTVSAHSVTSFRHRLGVEQLKATEGQPSDAVFDLVRRGDFLRAYDTAAALIEHGETDPEVRYLATLSLAKAGATSLARQRFGTFGLDTLDPSVVSTRLANDIAALLPRLDKDMALASAGEARVTWARRSATGYETAYRNTSSPYHGTNAATMWLMAGDQERSGRLAAEVLDGSTGRGGSYWEAATDAECALLLGHLPEAADALGRAGRADDSDPTARATTLRQLRMVCELKDIAPEILAPINNATIVHYTGHRISPIGSAGRFSAGEEERVTSEIRRHLAELQTGIGFGSLAAGADIISAEALIEMGAELHVVLPFDRDEFVRVSVAPAGAEWVSRFEQCLASAAHVTTATTSEYLDDPVLFDFCAQIAMGDALVRASVMQADAVQLAVWDRNSHGGPVGTEVDIARWRSTGKRTLVVDVHPGAMAAGGGESQVKRQIRGLVFADFAGFSTLSDAQVFAFQDRVMGAISRVVLRYETHLLSGRTWGDGVYLVFGDICAAAECALALQEAAREIDFDGIGLGTMRGMRVAAHAAPVFDGWDPISGNRIYFGSGVTRAARIEPRTPEGEVYVTHPFAALAMLSAERSFECNYVGTIQAAKSYGPVALYSLRPRHDARKDLESPTR